MTSPPRRRHLRSSETVVILRGRIQWIFYDDAGIETERVTLDADGPLRMLVVEQGRWHSLLCLDPGSVLFESKDGKYEPLGGGGGDGRGCGFGFEKVLDLYGEYRRGNQNV